LPPARAPSCPRAVATAFELCCASRAEKQARARGAEPRPRAVVGGGGCGGAAPAAHGPTPRPAARARSAAPPGPASRPFAPLHCCRATRPSFLLKPHHLKSLNFPRSGRNQHPNAVPAQSHPKPFCEKKSDRRIQGHFYCLPRDLRHGRLTFRLIKMGRADVASGPREGRSWRLPISSEISERLRQGLIVICRGVW
jgi:hypothetical protein